MSKVIATKVIAPRQSINFKQGVSMFFGVVVSAGVMASYANGSSYSPSNISDRLWSERGTGQISQPTVSIRHITGTLIEQLHDTPVRFYDGEQGTHIAVSSDYVFIDGAVGEVINPAFYETILKIKDIFAYNPNLEFTIAVFTDDVLNTDQALVLSQRQAIAVSEFFMGQGIDASRILAVRGMGDVQRLSTENTIAARSINRRVEFIVPGYLN